ncbi:glycerophosphoryl diester phosphodiesterase membrane domain-containing protein [Erythrobacter sp. F6033]|uniref:glycerophosphoryl diester phosphodiesterase membrane domain-containing protein n=1 Tax=Erythrobacter sp. F6033 TaxID=2926401 RepID=UPI001FF1F735|nr:glycerophosphoryl diester phosphodiesterase membrane domain-containing protein [Erythrobacter sp. F6033]MCK0128625.1 glycerophosphoryl diester phosphodiesterase membrane domain-containing protein [Erythrobacter sp. F6033]
MNQGLTLSSLLGQTFAELRENGRLVGIFLAIMVPINAFNGWIGEGGPSSALGFNAGFNITEKMLAMGAGVVIIYIVAFLISIVLIYWLYAALMARDPSPGFGRFWPWLGIYLLAILGIGLGILLLIVPGIILIVRWSLALPLVIEGKLPAMDTFGESWEKTSGHSWSIFGAAVILAISIFIVSAVLGGFTGLLSGFSSIPIIVASAIADSVASAIFIGLAIAIYRLSSDPAEEMMEVFE